MVKALTNRTPFPVGQICSVQSSDPAVDTINCHEFNTTCTLACKEPSLAVMGDPVVHCRSETYRYALNGGLSISKTILLILCNMYTLHEYQPPIGCPSVCTIAFFVRPDLDLSTGLILKIRLSTHLMLFSDLLFTFYQV